MPFAVAGAVIGAYGAISASKNAKKASKNQQAAMDKQSDLGNEQLDFAKQQYTDWQKRFNPVMDDLEKEAYTQQRPDYSAIAADNTSAFDASQGAAQRNLERFGVNPADGAYADLQQRGTLQRALGLVTANTQARTAAKDATYNRLANLYAVGNGQQSSATSAMNAAYNGLNSAFGQHAGIYGNQANNYNNQAQAGWNDAATGVGYGLQNWLGSGSGQPASAAFQPNVGTVGMTGIGNVTTSNFGAPNPFAGG